MITGWYLEDIHLVVDWQSFYAVGPLDGVPSKQTCGRNC